MFNIERNFLLWTTVKRWRDMAQSCSLTARCHESSARYHIIDWNINRSHFTTKEYKSFVPPLTMINYFSQSKYFTILFNLFFLSMQDIYAGDILNILRSMMRMSGWVAGLFFICRFGDQVTLRFENIAKLIIEFSHHNMTPKMTELSSIMVKVAQKPIYLHACFNVRCLPDTFQKVSSIKLVFFHFQPRKN